MSLPRLLERYISHVLVTGITTVSALLTDNTYSHCTGDKALDGRKTYQGEDICSTCSIVAPGTDQQQWWQLDLGRKHLIRTIIVTGRMGTQLHVLHHVCK